MPFSVSSGVFGMEMAFSERPSLKEWVALLEARGKVRALPSRGLLPGNYKGRTGLARQWSGAVNLELCHMLAQQRTGQGDLAKLRLFEESRPGQARSGQKGV